MHATRSTSRLFFMHAVRKPTALVIEREDDLREAIAFLLGECGAEVQRARDGFDALECLEKTRPDLVVLDVEPEPAAAARFLAHLASDPDLATVPVFLVADEPVGMPAHVPLTAGDVFLKPFDAEVFSRAARLHLAARTQL
jgi:CheY-like chemotaxis protein